jgi:hypothetical protein
MQKNAKKCKKMQKNAKKCKKMQKNAKKIYIKNIFLIFYIFLILFQNNPLVKFKNYILY